MRPNRCKSLNVRGAGAMLAMLLAACGPASTADDSRLQDLHGVAELKQRFNRDSGSPRLILLLSPT